ncbi:hypothetical protein Ndes2526B_g04495 [Nannochloris sp. 'desiccata']|nr:hypothetical protein KSW81_000760 [Chlorella desiccata (nom. nud.)]KAH7620576.1 hypothetical protein NADE_003192 [Chlorella desiccata (nom. nud.)]
MGKILDEPKFPVVNRAPSFWQTVGNFNLKDWALFGGLTAISYPLGFAAGGNPSPAFAKISGAMNRPSGVMGAIIGATAGFMLAYQNSGGRLMGFVPNDEEVRAAARQ